MKFYTMLFCLAFLLFIGGCSPQLPVNCAGKVYDMGTFIADTPYSFNNDFVKKGILPSIKKSKYDIEIRYNFFGAFGWQPGEGHCIIIRGNRDSLYAIDYFLKDKYYGDKPDGKVITKYKYDNLRLFVRKLTPKASISSLLQKLIDNHVMDIKDNKAIMHDLSTNHVKLDSMKMMDCCANILYEVKVQNHYRNFTTNPYFYNNTNIPELMFSKNIYDVFSELVPNFFD